MATKPPYLAPQLKDEGYTGATGTTPYKPASQTQQAARKELSVNMTVLSEVSRVRKCGVGPEYYGCIDSKNVFP